MVTVISNKVYVKLHEGDTVAHERNEDGVNVIYDMPPNPDELEVGTNIIAHWSGVPAYLPGTITKIEGERYHVLYDDHDQGVKKIEQIRVLKPPRYFGPGSGRTKVQKKFSMKTTSLTASGRSDGGSTHNTSSFKQHSNNENKSSSGRNNNNADRYTNHLHVPEGSRNTSNTQTKTINNNGRLSHLNESSETLRSSNNGSKPSGSSGSSSRTSSRDSSASDKYSESSGDELLTNSERSRESVDRPHAENLSPRGTRGYPGREGTLNVDPNKLSSKSFSYSTTTRNGSSEQHKRSSPLPQNKYSHLIAGRYNDRNNDLTSKISRENSRSGSNQRGLSESSDIPLIHRTMSNVENTRRKNITEL